LSAEESTKALLGSKVIHHCTPRFPIPEGPAQTIAPFFVFLEGLRVGRNCDVVVCQFQPHHFIFLAGIATGKVLGLPIVARANDVFLKMGEKLSFFQRLNRVRRRMYNIINEYFVKWSDVFLVVCSENGDILRSRMSSLNNILINHNGVDPTEFLHLNSKKDRDALDIKDCQKMILFTGRFSAEEYRVDILIGAYAIVKKKYPEALLFLVGDNLPKALENEALKLNVRVVGHIPRKDIIKYLSASDICIGSLGKTHSISLKILEYMAAGKPIVTGKGSVSEDLAFDEKNCIMADMKPEAIANAIIRLLDDNELANKLVQNASETIKGFYWNNIAFELETIINKTVEEAKRE
jgi:glycosyltransferase involved in cell wall biosynthesis